MSNNPSLSGFRTIRFLVDTAAGWAASTRKLQVNDVAVVSDNPGIIKFGNGVSSNSGSIFSVLPAYVNEAVVGKTPFTKYAQNTTGTITAANLLKKWITSTSAAAVALTLPTATLLGAALNAAAFANDAAFQGTEFEFTVDNSAGANTVTVAVGTGIVAATPALTGGATLTVAAGTFGKFKIIFKTKTTALIFRVL